MQTLSRDRDSIEYLDYQFETFLVNGQPVTPPATYQMAAVLTGTRPTVSDWNAAPWLAGPFTPGRYDVYLKFTDTPEIPVRRVARLIVT